MNKLDSYTLDQIKEIVKSSYSFAECCRKIGYSDKGRYGADMIKQYCADHNIDYSHFSANHTTNKAQYSLDEILVQNSNYKNIARLKIRVINAGLLEYKCALCGNEGMWNNLPLTLELDHINGDHLDHRIENLRLLCPNCHSQTSNYSGRNKKTPS